MSRAQGDYYKTHTDHNLNAYRARLDEKLRKLTDHKTKWYRFGEGWILTEERNRIINRRGHWKWEGWEVEAHEYWIKVFPAECVTVKDGVPTVNGLAQAVKVIDDDKAAANTYFQNVAKPLAKDLTTWIPREANNGVYLNYKGRKPSAVIIIDWEGDSYFFKLVVDGAEVMSSKSREELKAEAERLGAVLEETHTPGSRDD